MSTWRWVRHEGQKLYDIGAAEDGTLHNPNGYPEATVRAAVAGAEERRRQRRSKAAKKAAETRRQRHEQLVYQAARCIIDGEVFGPREHCFICGKGLGDPESIKRGIGPDCWQFVLDGIKGHLALDTGGTA